MRHCRVAIEPPRIERAAPVPASMVFWFRGRALRVVRAAGEDGAAPVICEELEDFSHSLAGQLSIWSMEAVRRVIARQKPAPIGQERQQACA